MNEKHFCWMDPTTLPGRLLVPRSDPNFYESPADLLFGTAEEAKDWRDEEIEAYTDEGEHTDATEVTYIRSWVLCIRTLEVVA